jgi:hypothetical protein
MRHEGRREMRQERYAVFSAGERSSSGGPSTPRCPSASRRRPGRPKDGVAWTTTSMPLHHPSFGRGGVRRASRRGPHHHVHATPSFGLPALVSIHPSVGLALRAAYCLACLHRTTLTRRMGWCMHRMLPAACRLLPAACGLRPAACGLLPASCRLPPAACRLLPAACCLLPASCCLPPAACCLQPIQTRECASRDHILYHVTRPSVT